MNLTPEQYCGTVHSYNWPHIPHTTTQPCRHTHHRKGHRRRQQYEPRTKRTMEHK